MIIIRNTEQRPFNDLRCQRWLVTYVAGNPRSNHDVDSGHYSFPIIGIESVRINPVKRVGR
ncbi:hypothetical protein LMG27174_07302 [Paraburkholderia rhynchosiae]|uniref:Uncharacterized protein n=1 Tax=Paraburkholderia rhynchosiae TaxID=487049 RepID=A0A2N7VH28_9BURK|nr:hypothetical protein C0Z16_36860 [Paraburkholderia rhynchosiae]CAB3745162.1 hypothetical protein LMG27174_07302 [Paraburkholderia rhynchosiae]